MLHKYTGLFYVTKRIELKLDTNITFWTTSSLKKTTTLIPASLYSSLPPLHTDNEAFYRRWRHISHSAAYQHLKLLITECTHNIKAPLTKELSHQMELLRNSCLPDALLLAAQANWIPWLAWRLTHTRTKRAARFRGIIDHNFTENSLNQRGGVKAGDDQCMILTFYRWSLTMEV